MPLPDAIVQTVLIHLTALFVAGANGDEATARLAASQRLDAYNPQNANELRLAASIIGFGFHSLDALSQSAGADLPPNHAMRLRSAAVSLNQEAAKAKRRLGQVQKARLHTVPGQQSELKVEKAVIQDIGGVAVFANAATEGTA